MTDGGTITKNAKGVIEVNGANSMTVYLRGLTDFDPDAPTYVSGTNLLAGRAAATVMVHRARVTMLCLQHIRPIISRSLIVVS